ncbi:J domain-containing protein [Sphingosinithalassobacter tenebrarum]|uniref:J domain-containing protein n=1 Tax=Stakelama tenebrarum TaxID=2711215 RepID=A0A6G6YAN7_9SPHN|nr:J domain-containing protein [Sphingosinithalassobacter tenebrarum]
MWKFLTAVAVVYFSWRLWHGRRRLPGSPIPAEPRGGPARGSSAEARALLGVSAGADAETVRTAHRKLIARVHPDHGGNAELTRQVNAARDLLLQELEGSSARH